MGNGDLQVITKGSGGMSPTEILGQATPFFRRPEGKSFGRWGMVAGGLGTVVAIGVLQHLGIFALLFAGAMWIYKVGAALLGLFLLTGILTSPKTKLLYQLVCWHLHNRLVESLDPEVRYNFALEQQQTQVIDPCVQKKGDLRAAIVRCETSIKENDKAIDEHKGVIQEAMYSTVPEEIAVREAAADAIPVLQEANREYQDNLDLFNEIYEQADAAILTAKTMQSKIKLRLGVLSQRRKTLGGAEGLVAEMRQLLGGGVYQRMISRADEQMLDDIARSTGVLRDFADEIRPLNVEMDLKRRARVRKVMDEMKQQIQLPEQSSAVPASSVIPQSYRKPVGVPAQSGDGRKSSFDNL